MATDIHSSGPSQDTNKPLTSKTTNIDASDKDEEDLGLSLSEGENENGDEDDNNTGNNSTPDDEDDEEDRRIANIGDENPQLMAYLDHSDSNNSNAIATSSEEEEEGGDGDGEDDDGDLDDSRIEAQEELAILADFKEKDKNHIKGPLSLRRLSQSRQARDQNGGDSDDSDSDPASENSSWHEDFLESYFDLPNNKDQQRSMRSKSFRKNENGHHQLNGIDIDMEDGQHNHGHHNRRQHQHAHQHAHHAQPEDEAEDSYLWQYFFSSDENNEDMYDLYAMSNPTSRARQRRLSRSKRASVSAHNGAADLKHEDDGDGSTDDDLPMKGRGPLAPAQMAKNQPVGYIPSGDSTDEDDGVPPERKRRRARGSKAIEVLGSNSFSARPPVLGSWRIKGDKNIGIIDGLTTRTLSPPPPPHSATSPSKPYNESSDVQGQQSATGGGVEDPQDPFEGLDVKDLGLDAIGDFTDFAHAEQNGTPLGDDTTANFDDTNFDEEVSDLDLLELGDFIHTEPLSSDENETGHFEFDLVFDPQQNQQQQQQQNGSAHDTQKRSPNISPYLYRNRMSNRNAPIPAFRNRGSPFVSNVAYPTDNFSPAPRRPSRRGSFRKPLHARDTHPSPGVNPRKRGKKARTGSRTLHGLADESGERDFIGELIEIGAISPLFEVE